MTSTPKEQAVNLKTKTARAALPHRPDPYFVPVRRGVAVGYLTTGKGTAWKGRAIDPQTGKYAFETFSDIPDDAQAYDSATRMVLKWADELARGITHRGATVTDACKAYVAHIRIKKGDATARDAENLFKRIIYSAHIGRVELARLAPMQVQAVRDGMVKTEDARDADHLRRMKATANRHLSRLIAALNYARKMRMVASNDGWAVVEKFKAVDGRRTLMLTNAQADALVRACPADLSPLVRAFLLTGARPGELPKLTVEQFDPVRGTLRIVESKTKARDVVLSDEAVAFFKRQCKNKLPAALIFVQADGKPWKNSNAWNPPTKAAAKASGLPAAFTLYTLRHTYISRAIHAGVDLLTVARLVGTSITMIEKNYGQMARAEDVRIRLNAIPRLPKQA